MIESSSGVVNILSIAQIFNSLNVPGLEAKLYREPRCRLFPKVNCSVDWVMSRTSSWQSENYQDLPLTTVKSNRSFICRLAREIYSRVA